MRSTSPTQFRYVVSRAGWWGVGFFLGALFFLFGSLVSLFDGDMRIALQSLVVAIALWGVALLIYRKRA